MRKLVFAALFLLCGGAQAKTDIEFWHAFSGGNGNAIDEIAKLFNESQTDVTVKPVYTGNYEEGTAKLQAAIQGRVAPALTMLEITRYGLFAERGALEPLEAYIGKEGPDFLSRIRPFALDASKYKGKSYVLPFNVSNPLLYYNKALYAKAGLSEPPKTWAELIDHARKLTVRNGEKITQWGLNTPPQWVRWAMAHQAGGGWMNNDTGEVQIDQPPAIRAYKTAADWVSVDKVASAEAALAEKTAVQYFVSGLVGLHFDSTGSLGQLSKDSKFDLGAAPLPCDVVCAAPIGGATIGIVSTAGAEAKQAAWRFVAFVNRPEINALVFARTGYLPIVEGALDQPAAREAIAKTPAYLVADRQLSVAFARARQPAMPAIRSKEEAVWQTIVLGRKSAEEALKAFGNEMRALLAGG